MSTIGFLVSANILMPVSANLSLLNDGAGVNILLNEKFWPGRVIKTYSNNDKIDLSMMSWDDAEFPDIGDVIGVYMGPHQLVAQAIIKSVDDIKSI